MEYERYQKEAIKKFAQCAIETFPDENPRHYRNAPYMAYFHLDEAMRILGQQFRVCNRNVALDQYLKKIDKALRETTRSETHLKVPGDIRQTSHAPRPSLRFLTVATALGKTPEFECFKGEPTWLADTLFRPVQTTVNNQLSNLLRKVRGRAATKH